MSALPPKKRKTAEQRTAASKALRGQWALTEPLWVSRTRGLKRPDPASLRHRLACTAPAGTPPLLIKVAATPPLYRDVFGIFACECGAQVTVFATEEGQA